MKVILIISRRFLPSVGGVENYTEILGNGFLKRGFKVIILTNKHSKGLKNYEQIKGFEVYRYKNYFHFIFLLIKLNYKIKFYFIISNQLLQETFFIGFLKYIFLLNIPVIGCCHEGGMNSEIMKIVKKYSFLKIHKLILFFIFQIDYINYLTETVKKQLKLYFPSKKYNKKLIFIPNGYDFSNFGVQKKKQVKNILFISRIEKEKGIFDLIDSFKNIKNNDIRLNICGFGDNRIESILINKIKDDKRIKFLGKITGKDKDIIFKNNDLFCLPSYHHEGQPISLLEAINYNLIILTTKVGNNYELYGDNIFYFKEKDKIDLQEKLEFIIKKGGEINHDYNDITDFLDIKIISEKYIKLIKNNYEK